MIIWYIDVLCAVQRNNIHVFVHLSQSKHASRLATSSPHLLRAASVGNPEKRLDTCGVPVVQVSSMAEDDVTFPFNGCDSWEWKIKTWEFLVVEGVEMHMGGSTNTLLVKLGGVATWYSILPRGSQVFRWLGWMFVGWGPSAAIRSLKCNKARYRGVSLISSGLDWSHWESIRISSSACGDKPRPRSDSLVTVTFRKRVGISRFLWCVNKVTLYRKQHHPPSGSDNFVQTLYVTLMHVGPNVDIGSITPQNWHGRYNLQNFQGGPKISIQMISVPGSRSLTVTLPSWDLEFSAPPNSPNFCQEDRVANELYRVLNATPIRSSLGVCHRRFLTSINHWLLLAGSVEHCVVDGKNEDDTVKKAGIVWNCNYSARFAVLHFTMSSFWWTW